ncbi:MAG: hypothetical protein ACFFF4_18605 [Candidatus Thorarchaeota archaeon]
MGPIESMMNPSGLSDFVQCDYLREMITLYLLVLGVVIGIVFYGYTKTLRRPGQPGLEADPSSSGMTSGPVNQTRAVGAAPKVMPVNLRTGHEEEK